MMKLKSLKPRPDPPDWSESPSLADLLSSTTGSCRRRVSWEGTEGALVCHVYKQVVGADP